MNIYRAVAIESDTIYGLNRCPGDIPNFDEYSRHLKHLIYFHELHVTVPQVDMLRQRTVIDSASIIVYLCKQR